jgi:glutamate-ammonia-ligase adenylyltransferase
MEDRGRILKAPVVTDYLKDLLPATRRSCGGSSTDADLRRRHQEALATIALRDINRQATLRQVLKSLSDLAEATIQATARLARREIAGRGRPVPRGLRLAVLGLGRLGYREMDYSSDVDLVFVCRAGGRSPREGRFARVWCERIVELLSSLSRDGQLYRVDLRLRPSGGEGELVTTESGLQDYFRDAAEVWEMQSFLKARPVAGDADLGRRLVETIETLILERGATLGAQSLRRSVDEMRRRLVQEARPEDRGSVKLGEGGLFDIHFIIEYLQLRHGVGNPADKDTLRLLTTLNRLGHLSDAQLRVLYESYLFFRTLDHEMRLIHDRPMRGLPEDPARLAEFGLAFERTARDPDERARHIRETFQRHADEVRQVYAAIVG